jgi:hypothetical protein
MAGCLCYIRSARHAVPLRFNPQSAKRRRCLCAKLIGFPLSLKKSGTLLKSCCNAKTESGCFHVGDVKKSFGLVLVVGISRARRAGHDSMDRRFGFFCILGMDSSISVCAEFLQNIFDPRANIWMWPFHSLVYLGIHNNFFLCIL